MQILIKMISFFRVYRTTMAQINRFPRRDSTLLQKRQEAREPVVWKSLTRREADGSARLARREAARSVPRTRSSNCYSRLDAPLSERELPLRSQRTAAHSLLELTFRSNTNIRSKPEYSRSPYYSIYPYKEYIANQ